MEWSAIIPVFTFILGLLGKIFYDMWHDNYIEKKRLRKEILKNHFMDLETKVIRPLSLVMGGICSSDGKLWYRSELNSHQVTYSNPSYAWSLTKDFQGEAYYAFKLHFATQEGKSTKIMSEVEKHNKNYESFKNNLGKLIQEKTDMPIRAVGAIENFEEERPFIYAEVPTYLQQALYYLPRIDPEQRQRGKRSFDFQQSEIKREPDGYWRLHGSSAAYAQTTTEEEANLCKQTLIELMESIPLLEEMYGIYKEANRLESESRSLASLLDIICEQYDKYSSKLLKRERDCPICQVIFE